MIKKLFVFEKENIEFKLIYKWVKIEKNLMKNMIINNPIPYLLL